MAGIRAREPGRIYGVTVDPFTPVVEHFHETAEESVERQGLDTFTELLDRSEM